jgi:hypothetical protein
MEGGTDDDDDDRDDVREREMIKQTRCCAVRGAYPSPLLIV